MEKSFVQKAYQKTNKETYGEHGYLDLSFPQDFTDQRKALSSKATAQRKAENNAMYSSTVMCLVCQNLFMCSTFVS